MEIIKKLTRFDDLETGDVFTFVDNDDCGIFLTLETGDIVNLKDSSILRGSEMEDMNDYEVRIHDAILTIRN